MNEVELDMIQWFYRVAIHLEELPDNHYSLQFKRKFLETYPQFVQWLELSLRIRKEKGRGLPYPM